MLEVTLLEVDPTNRPATNDIAEKSKYGGHYVRSESSSGKTLDYSITQINYRI